MILFIERGCILMNTLLLVREKKTLIKIFSAQISQDSRVWIENLQEKNFKFTSRSTNVKTLFISLEIKSLQISISFASISHKIKIHCLFLIPFAWRDFPTLNSVRENEWVSIVLGISSKRDFIWGILKMEIGYVFIRWRERESRNGGA